jgi:glycosyltransferase involved in cell wall biosynthesis
MMEIVKAMPEVKFYLVMTEVGVKELKMKGFKEEKDYPKNVKVLVNIPYQQFMRCLCQSKVMCMPLNCEAPQGLIVMFEAAANDKLILTSDTPTTNEYFEQGQRFGKNIDGWCNAIRYYLAHDDERREKAMAFHKYLKEECGEKQFARTVVQMTQGFYVPQKAQKCLKVD